ncbi:FmdB family zinc ribbon protein [Acetonema longum]|uniref:FmdB family zinc ribbon protein n=1 Tax=Acetonema longum TaxID=2374 RepID=UPI000907C262
MPLYEFKCLDCHAQFEKICGIEWNNAPHSVICPKCGHNNLQKLISQFAGTGRAGGSGCSSCSGNRCGSCK